MKRIIGAFLISGLWGGALMAKDLPSALSQLTGGQSELLAPAPVLRPMPAFDHNDGGFYPHNNPVMEACRGEQSCFMALNGTERQLCQAYKEDKSCFMALDGADRGWCQVLKEGKSCFMALDGQDSEECEKGRYPRQHAFWARCGNIELPVNNSPVMQACTGKKSCFMALDGVEQGLCQAYKEDKSCFMALDGADRGWCEVLKEGKSCFMALDGEDQRRCERGRFPWDHLFWKRCGAQGN